MSEAFDDERSPRYLTAEEESSIKDDGNKLILIFVAFLAVLIILFAAYASTFKPPPIALEKPQPTIANATSIEEQKQVKKQKNEILQKIEEINKQIR